MQAVDAPASPGAGPADSPNSSAMPAPSAQGALGGGPSGSSAPPSPAPRQARVPAALSQATGTGHSSSAPPLSPATTPDPPPVPSTSSSPLRSPSSPSPSPALPAPQTHKRVLLRRPSSSASRAPQSDASPLPSTEARARNGSIGDIARRTSELALGEAADGSGESSQGPAGDGSVAPLDPVLHAALNHPRDRLLLLRAEVEMERFVASPSCVRYSRLCLREMLTCSCAVLRACRSRRLTSSPVSTRTSGCSSTALPTRSASRARSRLLRRPCGTRA